MGRINLADSPISEKTRQLLAGALVWDDHICMPLRPQDETFLPQLQRAKDSGYDIVSLNIGFDVKPWENAILTVATMRRWIKQRPESYVLIESVADIERSRQDDKLGVVFDMEGGVSLNEHLPMVQLYYDLGVRWMLLAYNLNNSLAGGCLDNNMGLTEFGRQVVREMERVGMAICCSHVSHQTAMEVMEMAENPVIFSHSNPMGMWSHFRNVQDEAIRACADTGGVIGITGVGDFLGDNENLAEAMARHVDYVVQLVGPDHVGIGSDYTFDHQEVIDFVKDHPESFDPAKWTEGIPIIDVELIPEVADRLSNMSYSDQDIRNILGGNHLRVASQVWK